MRELKTCTECFGNGGNCPSCSGSGYAWTEDYIKCPCGAFFDFKDAKSGVKHDTPSGDCYYVKCPSCDREIGI